VDVTQGGGTRVSAEEEGVHRVPGNARHDARESEPGAHSRVQVSARAVQPVQPETAAAAAAGLRLPRLMPSASSV